MANSFTDAIPEILRLATLTLRANTPTVARVDRTYDPRPGEKGDSVDVVRVDSMTAYDIVPASTSQTPSDVITRKTAIPLSNWKGQSIAVSDKDVNEVLEGTFPKAWEQAIISIADAVEMSVQAQAKKFYQATGTPGTVPFASATIADAVAAHKLMNDTKTPMRGRNLTVGSAAWANMLSVPAFHNAYQMAGSQVLREAELERVLGLNVGMSQLVTSHTAGTGSGYLVNNGAGLAVGAKTATVDTGSGTILVGDIVTFAGHTQTYVVTAALAANNFSFEPGIVTAVADNAAVTVKATHQLNFAFHQNAIQLVTRPPLKPMFAEADRVQAMRDEQSGLVLAFECHREWYRDHCAFSVLWGDGCAYREGGVRLMG